LRLAWDRSLVDIAKAAGLRYGLVWRWTQRDEPPRGMSDRIARLESALGGSLVEGHELDAQKGAEAVIDESRLPDQDGPGSERYIQPLDFKKKALDEVGLARHELATAIAAIQDGMYDMRAIGAFLESADQHASLAERHLRGRMKIRGKGERI